MKDRDEPRDAEDVAAERRAAMWLAHRQAARGEPLAGALFGMLHDLRQRSPEAAFMDDFYEYLDEDDDDDMRPY